jgi:hypothetical protein
VTGKRSITAFQEIVPYLSDVIRNGPVCRKYLCFQRQHSPRIPPEDKRQVRSRRGRRGRFPRFILKWMVLQIKWGLSIHRIAYILAGQLGNSTFQILFCPRELVSRQQFVEPFPYIAEDNFDGIFPPSSNHLHEIAGERIGTLNWCAVSPRHPIDSRLQNLPVQCLRRHRLRPGVPLILSSIVFRWVLR